MVTLKNIEGQRYSMEEDLGSVPVVNLDPTDGSVYGVTAAREAELLADEMATVCIRSEVLGSVSTVTPSVARY